MMAHDQKLLKPSQHSFVTIRAAFIAHATADGAKSFIAAAQTLNVNPDVLRSYLSQCILKYIDPGLVTLIQRKELLFNVIIRLTDEEAHLVQERHRVGTLLGKLIGIQSNKNHWQRKRDNKEQVVINNAQMPPLKRRKIEFENECNQTPNTLDASVQDNQFSLMSEYGMLMIEIMQYLQDEIRNIYLEMVSISEMQNEIKGMLETITSKEQTNSNQAWFSFYQAPERGSEQSSAKENEQSYTCG